MGQDPQALFAVNAVGAAVAERQRGQELRAALRVQRQLCPDEGGGQRRAETGEKKEEKRTNGNGKRRVGIMGGGGGGGAPGGGGGGGGGGHAEDEVSEGLWGGTWPHWGLWGAMWPHRGLKRRDEPIGGYRGDTTP